MYLKKIFVCLFVFLLLFCEKQENATNIKTDVRQRIQRQNPVFGEFDPQSSKRASLGGSYTTWGGAFPKSLNMFLDYNSFSTQITQLLFEPLLTLHSTENKPVGVLAKSWKVSEDLKIFRFRLQPNAKWSDGHPITAEDIQFYYDVIMNPKNRTTLFRVGLRRFNRPVIIDEKTIEIVAHTKHWKNFYEAGGFYALPKHIWEDQDFNKINFKFSVVSGPYQLKEVKRGQSLQLERRWNWWGDQNFYNRYKYNFSTVKFKFIDDRNKALEAFKKGIFDVYPIYTSSIWEKKTNFLEVQKNWVVRQKIHNEQPIGFQGFAMNTQKFPFNDILVRKALQLLLNRSIMNEKLMYNAYTLLNSYYPDLYSDIQNPETPVIKYNPELARKLLKQSGWVVNKKGILEKNGQELKINFTVSSHDLRHLNLYIEDLKKVGIVPIIEKMSWATISKRMDDKKFDLYWSSWGASRLKDPEQLWYSGQANLTASQNWTGIQDSVVDFLIKKQKGILDINQRNDILKKIDLRLVELAPYVLLWQANYHRVLYWNKFGKPKNPLGRFGDPNSIIEYWWNDSNQNKKLINSQSTGRSLKKNATDLHYLSLHKN